MFVIWGAVHGCALGVHRLWKRFGRPMPEVLAWLLTFIFVNVAWVFFRAKTLGDAVRVLRGMVDFRSAFGHTVASTPTADLAWGGWLSDCLMKFMPISLIGQTPVYLAIIVAFVVIRQKNSIEMASGAIGTNKLIFGGVLFSVAMYFTLAATSSVFLYFNF
jgi:hypothetical protein